MIEADLLGAVTAWGSPAKRLARAAEGRAVRPHQKTTIAPTIAMAPRMTVRFMDSFLFVSASQGDGVDDLAHPDRAENHQHPADDEGGETGAVRQAGQAVRVGAPLHERHQEGHCSKDPGGQPPLSSECVDVARHPLAL